APTTITSAALSRARVGGCSGLTSGRFDAGTVLPSIRPVGATTIRFRKPRRSRLIDAFRDLVTRRARASTLLHRAGWEVRLLSRRRSEVHPLGAILAEFPGRTAA